MDQKFVCCVQKFELIPKIVKNEFVEEEEM